MQVQSVTEFEFKEKTAAFYLFPGLNNGVVAVGASATAAFAPHLSPYSQHLPLPYNFPSTANPDLVDLNGSIIIEDETLFQLNKWRLVGQASSFSLVNNSDENEGWYEAIRVDPKWSCRGVNSFVTVANPGEVDTTANGGSAEVLVGRGQPEFDQTRTNLRDVVPFIDLGADWSNHPSYVTGKVRDIHQGIFKLNSTQSDHDFSEICTTSDNNLEELKSIIDINYDCIAVRIHGRARPSTITAEPPTRIMIHTIAHQEMIFEENTLVGLSRTESPGSRTTYIHAGRASKAQTKVLTGYSDYYHGDDARFARRSYTNYRRVKKRTPRSRTTTKKKSYKRKATTKTTNRSNKKRRR